MARRRIRHRASRVSDIPIAMALLTVYHEVDILVPNVVESDRYLLNQVTLAMNARGYPPAAIYRDGDDWRLHARTSVERSQSIYARPALVRPLPYGGSSGPDAA